MTRPHIAIHWFRRDLRTHDNHGLFRARTMTTSPMRSPGIKAVSELLAQHGTPLRTFKDISIFERAEVVKDDGGPYTVFTSYLRKWRAAYAPSMGDPFPSGQCLVRLFIPSSSPSPALKDLGVQPTDVEVPPANVSDALLEHYAENRDSPALDGTSRMSVHLRSVPRACAISCGVRTDWARPT